MPVNRRHTPYLLTLNEHRGIAILLLVVDIVLVGLINRLHWWGFQNAWLTTLALIIVGLMIIGGAVNGRLEGVLIDSRNRISLSKFQIALWSVVVIATLVTGASVNLVASVKDLGGKGVLDIFLPPELLFAMGISATSFVATPALLSLKTDQSAPAATLESTSDRLNLAPGESGANGRVFHLNSPQLASWTDMFRGDEVSNAATADLSKVQQFGITMLIVGIYGASIWALLGKTPFLSMPALSTGLVTLMGISHASYLSYKAAPHGASDRGGDNSRDPRLDPAG